MMHSIECPRLRAALEALADKHNFDLYGGDGYSLVLELPGLMPFVVGAVDTDRIAFGYYKLAGMEWVNDPGIGIDIIDGRWVPAYFSTWPFGRLDDPPTPEEIEEYAELIRGRYVTSNRATASIRDGSTGIEIPNGIAVVWRAAAALDARPRPV